MRNSPRVSTNLPSNSQGGFLLKGLPNVIALDRDFILFGGEYEIRRRVRGWELNP